MVKNEDDAIEPDLVWWLVGLGQTDRETYRRLRALAWALVEANPNSSVKPNEVS